MAFEALGGEDDVLVLMVVGPQADALDTLPEPSSLNQLKAFGETDKPWCFWVVLFAWFECVERLGLRCFWWVN